MGCLDIDLGVLRVGLLDRSGLGGCNCGVCFAVSCLVVAVYDE